MGDEQLQISDVWMRAWETKVRARLEPGSPREKELERLVREHGGHDTFYSVSTPQREAFLDAAVPLAFGRYASTWLQHKLETDFKGAKGQTLTAEQISLVNDRMLHRSLRQLLTHPAPVEDVKKALKAIAGQLQAAQTLMETWTAEAASPQKPGPQAMARIDMAIRRDLVTPEDGDWDSSTWPARIVGLEVVRLAAHIAQLALDSVPARSLSKRTQPHLANRVKSGGEVAPVEVARGVRASAEAVAEVIEALTGVTESAPVFWIEGEPTRNPETGAQKPGLVTLLLEPTKRHAMPFTLSQTAPGFNLAGLCGHVFSAAMGYPVSAKASVVKYFEEGKSQTAVGEQRSFVTLSRMRRWHSCEPTRAAR